MTTDSTVRCANWPELKRLDPGRVSLVLGLFSAVFLGLCVFSYTRTSATYDESINLLSGYAILKYGDYRFSPDHVPFTRAWAALPLLFMRVSSYDPTTLPDTSSLDWVGWQQVELAQRFMYKWNDADRLLYAARFMMALLGVALGVIVFSWARELLGDAAAILALVFYTLNPNVIAHSPLVTADMGLACFIFGAAYFSWRTMRTLTFGNVIGLSFCTALALVSKFWGAVLVPVAAVCLLARAASGQPWQCRISRNSLLTTKAGRFLAAVLVILAVLATCYGGIWAAYGFQSRPCAETTEYLHFDRNDFVLQRAPLLAQRLRWIDGAKLLPNAFTQGFIYGTANIKNHPAYFAGRYSQTGWWYYFPVALLVKTPVSLLILLLLAMVLGLAHFGSGWRACLPLWLIPLAFFAVAMCGNVNIGLRHVLLVYPFASVAAAWPLLLLLRRSIKWIVLLAVLLAAGELAWVYPHCLAFFNCLVGGPARGHYYLADSNLDWGQGLKGLKQWMRRNQVEHINLSYFGTADPAYYGINYTPLLTGPFPAAERGGLLPRLPGYVAVSVTNLRGVYLDELGRAFYRPLLDIKPAAIIGHAIYVYWIERPWLHEVLACLQKEIAAQPESPRLRAHVGTVLFQLGRVAEAIEHYENALRLDPDDGETHYNLGNALFGQGRVSEAAAHYKHAVRLIPNFARGYCNLAVALSREGRFQEAIAHLEEALRLRPDYVNARENLVVLLQQFGEELANQNRWIEAIAQFERAAKIKPNDPKIFDSLAIAYSETGQFNLAVAAAERGLANALAAGDKSLAAQIEARLAHYRIGKPFHEMRRQIEQQPRNG